MYRVRQKRSSPLKYFWRFPRQSLELKSEIYSNPYQHKISLQRLQSYQQYSDAN